jgi:hypothetical protein
VIYFSISFQPQVDMFYSMIEAVGYREALFPVVSTIAFCTIGENSG